MAILALSRYLAGQDPEVVGFCRATLEQAETLNIATEDLAILRLLIKTLVA